MPLACTTELGEVARLTSAFEARGTKVLGLSVDALGDHAARVDDMEQTHGVTVDFPLIADVGGTVARLYGTIHETADPKLTVRSVVVVGPDGTVRATLTYPPSSGRNFAHTRPARSATRSEASARGPLVTALRGQVDRETVLTVLLDELDDPLRATILAACPQHGIPELQACAVLATLQMRRGDPDGRRTLEQASAMVEGTGAAWQTGRVALVRAEAAWLSGHPSSARRSLARSLARARELGYRPLIARLGYWWRTTTGLTPEDEGDEPELVQARGRWREAAALWGTCRPS